MDAIINVDGYWLRNVWVGCGPSIEEAVRLGWLQPEPDDKPPTARIWMEPIGDEL